MMASETKQEKNYHNDHNLPAHEILRIFFDCCFTPELLPMNLILIIRFATSLKLTFLRLQPTKIPASRADPIKNVQNYGVSNRSKSELKLNLKQVIRNQTKGIYSCLNSVERFKLFFYPPG